MELAQSRKRIYLVAGEHSGDFLGAALMQALGQALQQPPLYAGVGGDLMEAEGLHSLFPLDDVAVMGITEVIPRLPTLYRRGLAAVDAAIAFQPDIVIAIDSPEFTHAIARRIRRRLPRVPIVNYVSPSVWAWRSGRARKMRRYIDHVLALLPFEPDAHMRLGGPVCTYVGHPLLDKREEMKSRDPVALRQKLSISAKEKVLLILPGSRPNEIARLMGQFGRTAEMLAKQNPQLRFVIPVVASVRGMIEEALKNWVVKPHLVYGESDKFASFNMADAALAASGTVTLELAMLEVPMVVAYRVGRLESFLRGLVQVPSIVLANLVLGDNVFPEFIQEDCIPEKLVPAVAELLCEGPALMKQRDGLAMVCSKMQLADGKPADAAAKVVTDILMQ